MTADLYAAPWTPLLALALGAGFAGGYLRLVRHSAEGLVQGHAGALRMVLGLALRLALALAALALALMAGAGPVDLLAGALGFAGMRLALLRRPGR